MNATAKRYSPPAEHWSKVPFHRNGTGLLAVIAAVLYCSGGTGARETTKLSQHNLTVLARTPWTVFLGSAGPFLLSRTPWFLHSSLRRESLFLINELCRNHGS